MEKNEIKCSSSNHKENEAILFCQDCKIYLCKKCEVHHSELFQNHSQINIKTAKEDNELFTGLCTEKNHFIELKYFCKTHNKLCCSQCITKIKGEECGQHTDCDICHLKDIKEEKINKLEANIKLLEKLSKNIVESIKQIKMTIEKVEDDKEKLKKEIQSMFTKLRNLLNNKEDEILLQIDNKYEEIFFDKDYIHETEKLPEKINKSLEKGKIIKNDVEKYKLNSLIYDCINIENNILHIDKINTNIQKFKKIQNNKYFVPSQKSLEKIIEFINNSKLISQSNESEIITNKEFDQINEWLGERHEYILRYSAKNDGCNTDIFHKNCDNLSGIIIICKAKDSDIIGGFISTKILREDKFHDDNKAFLFNLTKNFVKRNKKSYLNAIKNYHDSSNFIRFGNSCDVFRLSGNCLNDKQSYAYNCGCETNFDTDSKNLFDTPSGTNFQVENFEVFEVI